MDSCPGDLQMEVIELQSNHAFLDKFDKDSLGNFYRFLWRADFANLKTFASWYLSIFGITYLCEIFFFKDDVKNELRSNLSDGDLKALLMLGIQNLKP